MMNHIMKKPKWKCVDNAEYEFVVSDDVWARISADRYEDAAVPFIINAYVYDREINAEAKTLLSAKRIAKRMLLKEMLKIDCELHAAVDSLIGR